LIETPKNGDKKQSVSGKQLYQLHCMSCHGANREGNEDGSYPSLQKIDKII
jgi:quinoprotein glucose dehydrogenase